MVDTPLQNPIDVHVGSRLAKRYRIERLVARGGMASVWLATDEHLRRPVAVKVLHEHLRDAISVERFRAEGKLAAQLSHPGVVAIYDTFHDRGIDGIVLEYVEGSTLRERLDNPPPLTINEACNIIAQIADALADAHRRGLIHRDIKPANILLNARGSVKVTDFGIAKMLDGVDLTQPGIFVGTAKYLAPEQITGEAVTGSADVYALGVLLFEMLTGSSPFAGESDAATALARLQLPAPPLRRYRNDLPSGLERLVERMLDRTPTRRPTMVEVLKELNDGHLSDRTPAMGMAVPSPTHARFRWGFVALSIAMVASFAFAAFLVGRTDAGRGLFVRLGIVESKKTSAPVEIPLTDATFTAFDPFGQDGEHDELLPFLHDANMQSVWTTETYSNPKFGGLKAGLGIVVDLHRTTTISEVQIRGASSGWSAVVYVAPNAPDAIDEWGAALARRTDIAGETTFSFAPTRGQTVLLWITDLGSDDQVRIGDLRLLGPG